MLKLSKLTDYAVVLMAQLAQEAHHTCSSKQLASATGIPQPTVVKLVKMLVHAGLLTSQRGALGGYQLARPANQIAVTDIIFAIEGPVAMTACSHGSDACDLLASCQVAGNWQKVTQAIQQLLAGISLAQLADRQAIRLPLVPIPIYPELN